MVTPILVELAPALYEQLGESSSPLFTEGVRRLRDALFFELGVRFPNVRTRANPSIARADGYIIYVHEIPVSRRFAPPRKLLVSESPARLRTLSIAAEPAVNPASDQPSAWVKSKYKALLDAAHIASWPSEELILLDLGAVLRRHAAQFIGVQDVQAMLDRLEGPFPALIRETVPRALSVTRLTDLLRRLVDDGISVRDLKGILQSIAQWSSTYDDNLELVEQIRCDMRGYVTHKYARGGDSLRAYIFDATIEDTIRGALTRSRAGVQLDLDPEIIDAIQRAVAQRIQGRKHAAGGPVFLTAPDLRAVMQGLLRRELPDVSVLSFQELDPALVVEPVARIRVDA